MIVWSSNLTYRPHSSKGRQIQKSWPPSSPRGGPDWSLALPSSRPFSRAPYVARYDLWLFSVFQWKFDFSGNVSLKVTSLFGFDFFLDQHGHQYCKIKYVPSCHHVLPKLWSLMNLDTLLCMCRRSLCGQGSNCNPGWRFCNGIGSINKIRENVERI